MSNTLKHYINNKNKASNLDWVAWGNKKAMYQIYGWKNHGNHAQRNLTRMTKDRGWISNFINMVGL